MSAEISDHIKATIKFPNDNFQFRDVSTGSGVIRALLSESTYAKVHNTAPLIMGR